MIEGDETYLTAGYREQAALYAQALHIAEQLPAMLRERTAVDDRLFQILGFFNQIAGVDARLAPAKERWKQSGQQAGAELRRSMDDVVALIEKLVPLIQQAEGEATAQRDVLGTELDTGIRARRMQQAYGAGK